MLLPLLGLLIGSNGAYAGGGDTIRVLLDSIRFTALFANHLPARSMVWTLARLGRANGF